MKRWEAAISGIGTAGAGTSQQTIPVGEAFPPAYSLEVQSCQAFGLWYNVPNLSTQPGWLRRRCILLDEVQSAPTLIHIGKIQAKTKFVGGEK
jgi:hypothetical protein